VSELFAKLPSLSLHELCKLDDMDDLIPTSTGLIRRYRKVLGAPIQRVLAERPPQDLEIAKPRLVPNERLSPIAAASQSQQAEGATLADAEKQEIRRSSVTSAPVVFPNLTPRPAPLKAVAQFAPTEFRTNMLTSSRGASVVAKLAPISGGITMKIGSSLTRITIPAMNSRHDCLDVLRGLLEAYDATPHRADWVLDCTAVDFIPNMLVGALVTYQRTLVKRGRLMDVLVSRSCTESRSFASEVLTHLDVQIVDQDGFDSSFLVGRRA